MKNQEFFITEESFSRAKKQLKKVLKNEGLDVSLSKSANLIAKSFGFNDEHQIQKFIGNKFKYNVIVDEIPFYYNITEDEALSFKEVIKIWTYILEDFKDNISSIIKNISNLSNDEIILIIKNTSMIMNTAEYMIAHRDSIMHGNISLRDADIRAMAYTRNFMSDLFKITSDKKYMLFYELMDAYHNIELYFYLHHDDRPDFWLQPKNFEYKSVDFLIESFNKDK